MQFECDKINKSGVTLSSGFTSSIWCKKYIHQNNKRPDQAVQNCLNRYQETRRRTTGHKTKKNVSGFKCNAANTINNELCLKHVVKC